MENTTRILNTGSSLLCESSTADTVYNLQLVKYTGGATYLENPTWEQTQPLIDQSRRILVTGFENVDVQTCRLAIQFAAQIRACCDPLYSTSYRYMLEQSVLEAWATCTFGEVQQRGDCIILWNVDFQHDAGIFQQLGCDSQTQTFPRHIYLINAINMTMPSLPDSIAITSLEMSAVEQIELLRYLRDTQTGAQHTHSVLMPLWQSMYRTLHQSSYPVCVWGDPETLILDAQRQMSLVDERLRLAKALMESLHLRHIDLCPHYGWKTFTQVATWLTGAAGALTFEREVPAFMSCKVGSTAQELLASNEVDLVIWIGAMHAKVHPSLQNYTGTLIHITGELDQVQVSPERLLHPDTGFIFRTDGIPMIVPEAARNEFSSMTEIIQSWMKELQVASSSFYMRRDDQ
jgi:formylmethanofuran dehydrogenase subunit B